MRPMMVRACFIAWALALVVTTLSCSKRDLSFEGESELREFVSQKGAPSAEADHSDLLCRLSEDHLAGMISREKIGHEGFEQRSQDVQKAGGGRTGEIVARNCGYRGLMESARQCVESWQNSEGHRVLMHQSWDSACYAMKFDGNNCYYCIGFFANGLKD